MQQILAMRQEILDKAEKMSESINNLRMEGKLYFQHNLQSLESVFNYFNKQLIPDMNFSEENVFPFVVRHVPRLENMITFLKGEHNEIRANYKILDELIQQVKKAHKPEEREKIIKKISQKGTYLFCLLRNHVQTENESIYKSIVADLNDKEKKELMAIMRRMH